MESIFSENQKCHDDLGKILPEYDSQFEEVQKDLTEIVHQLEDENKNVLEDFVEEESGSSFLGYCRICACAYESMISIYDDAGMEMQLEEKINNYLPINVTRNDKRPLQLCPVCVEKLNITHDLILTSLDSESKFKLMENHHYIEEEDPSAIKKKIVVMKLITSKGAALPMSAQVAKALQYLKEKNNNGESQVQTEENSSQLNPVACVQESSYQCSKKFATQQGLDQHETVHMGSRPYQCQICFIAFMRKTNLTKHYKTHAADKMMTCTVCKAMFPTAAGLLNHSKTHTYEELKRVNREKAGLEEQKSVLYSDSYQCSLCNKFLSSKLSLSLHMRTHTGVKPYQCDECKKRFTQRPALTYHQRLHTGERPHVCRFCNKGFNSKVGKESHERIHTGERPYKCGQCGLGFRCSANLRQHTWIHSDRRPFRCELCGKLFRRREALQVHMRIHTGERPYPCNVCGRCFTQKGDMMKHTRAHENGNNKGITCHNCGKIFNRKVNFRMHAVHCVQTNIQLVAKLPETSVNGDSFVLTEEMNSKDENDKLKAIRIAAEGMIPKYTDISIVPRDVVQEIEVEFEAK